MSTAKKRTTTEDDITAEALKRFDLLEKKIDQQREDFLGRMDQQRLETLERFETIDRRLS